jgi:Na+/melibiose symporter-like transporter
MDVICDALMVETGKPQGLTARFQSVQWTAVYLASIVAGLAGGWVAKNLRPQTVFVINALFPAVILAAILFFITENKTPGVKEQARKSLAALKNAFRARTLWLLAFFLFFWAFSPSFGTPFFYYAVDTLQFDELFFGIGASVGAASSALGALFYGKFTRKFKTRTFVKAMIIVGVIATLFDLIYFTSFITENLRYARIIYLVSAALLGAIGAITFLVLLNAAALAAPKYSEGTAFATLTSFWNIGLIGSSALGGFLFSKIGLQPLILVSALFTALAWAILPFLRFADEAAPPSAA